MRYCILAVLVAASAYVFLCGCGTVGNLQQSEQKVYGGVRADLDTVAVGAGLRESQSPSYSMAGVLAPFAVLDLPLSLVGDTVTLPWTVTAEVRRLVGSPDKPEQKTPSSAWSWDGSTRLIDSLDKPEPETPPAASPSAGAIPVTAAPADRAPPVTNGSRK